MPSWYKQSQANETNLKLLPTMIEQLEQALSLIGSIDGNEALQLRIKIRKTLSKVEV